MRPRPDVSILGLNYPPEATGIAPYTGALAAGLSNVGYSVGAHAAHPHYPEWKIGAGYGHWSSTEQVDGVRVHRRLHYVPRSPHGVRRLISEVSFGARLMVARWDRPRVVIAVSPSLFSTAMAVLRLRLTPRPPALIVWVQDIYTLGLTETGQGGGLAGRVIRWVEARTLRAADRVVVIHQRFADYIVDELGIRADNVVVVRNWAHLETTEPISSAAAKRTLGWPLNSTLAVHTGNMGVKQGLENVVESARAADEMNAHVHFLLIGDGSERKSLVELGADIARLTFIAPLNKSDYLLALSAADVLLVNEKPGVSEMAVPSKLTSYFHAGRPVIAATDKDGITAAEVDASCAGVVVPAGQPEALLQAVMALGAEPEKMAQLGINGRWYRERVLDERVAIANWCDLVRSVINLSERGGRQCIHTPPA